MSQTPYGGENPYATPTTSYSPPSMGNPLVIPASILLALAILWLLLQIVALPGQFARMGEIETFTPRGQGEMVGMITSLIFMFVFTITTIVGSICMLRMQGYTGAMAGAIAAVVPVCSPCFVLGIPFGIWAIIVLRQPDVVARFHS